jgi:hypothetical protein
LLAAVESEALELLKEKKGVLCGQNLLVRGKPIKNTGKVNNGNRGALNKEASSINIMPKGISNKKLTIIAASAFLLRCFLTVHAVIVKRKKANSLFKNCSRRSLTKLANRQAVRKY